MEAPGNEAVSSRAENGLAPGSVEFRVSGTHLNLERSFGE
jgi:hypothetical protein